MEPLHGFVFSRWLEDLEVVAGLNSRNSDIWLTMGKEILVLEVNANMPEGLPLTFVGCDSEAQPDRELSSLHLNWQCAIFWMK